MPDDLSSQVNIDTQAAQAQALAIQAAREDAQRRADAKAMRDQANAEVANSRAASQPFTTFSARYSDAVITAPADAGDAFDYQAYEAARYTGQPLGGQSVPPPPTASAVPGGNPESRFRSELTATGRWVGSADSGFVRGATFEDTSAPWYATEAESPGASPETASAAPPPRKFADYAQFRQAGEDIETDARNLYASSGRALEIGGETFSREVREAKVAAGLATESAAGAGEHGGGMGLAFGVGYAAMSLGSGVAGMQRLNAGQYVSPEQRDAGTAAAFGPGVGGLIGTVAGEAFGPAGGLLGQFAGQGVGSIYAATVGASDERNQATRETAERLAAALGSAAESTDRFKSLIEATGAPVAQLGEGLRSLQGISPGVGAAAVTGAGRMALAEGERFGEITGGVGGFLAGEASLYGARAAFATSGGAISSGDYRAIGQFALLEGNTGAYNAAQGGASAARYAADPEMQRLQRGQAADRGSWWDQTVHAAAGVEHSLKEHLGVFLPAVGLIPEGAFDREALTADQRAIDARRAAVDKQFADTGAADLALSQTYGKARYGLEMAGSEAGIAESGMALTRARGGGAAGLAAALPALSSALNLRGASDQTFIDQATASMAGLDSKDPTQAGILQGYQQDILRARQDQAQVPLAQAEARRDLFTTGLGEETAGYSLSDTRGLLSGRSAEDLLASRQRQAAFLDGTAQDPRNPLSPTERAGIEEGAARLRYTARQDVYAERLGNNANAIGAAQTGVESARSFGTAGQIDAALGTEAAAVAAQIAELTRELHTGGQTAADYRREQGELNQAQAQAVQIAAQRRDERVSNDYAVSGDRLSGDTAGLSRRVRLGGTASVDDGALDHDWEGVLGADQDAVNAYAPGTRQRADADAKLARDRADQAEQRDRLNAYTPDARTRTADTLGDLDVSRAEHAFRRAQESPYSDAGADPFARAGQLEGAIGRSETRLKADFGRETAFRRQRQGEGKWDDLAEEGYQDDYAHYQDRIEGLKDRRADLEHDKLESFFGALPEMVAGGRGLSAGVSSALVPTAALSAMYGPNAGVGSWGGGRRTASWWSGPGGHDDSPYGHAAGGDDPGAAASAGAGAGEGNRYLAVIAAGITAIKDHVTTGGSHSFAPSVPSHAVSTVAGALGFDLNPRTH